jgi:serine/threonine-protein kinase
VRVFDFGTTERGHPFLVMELAQGETLSSVLAREGRMGAIRAVQMLLPVADGLRCAHDKGIVHRDVKPDNLFIAKDSFGRLQPKLIDFGIARVRQPAIEQRLTQEGVVLGSPAYMSPEQALGDESIDGRSDLWGMCVMLYEMICARMPFQNENYNALMQAILHQAPVPTHTLGAGDAELWLVIAKGLAKSAEARYANVTELGGALALWLHRHGVKEDICGNSIRALWLHPSHPQAAQGLCEIQVNPESVVQTETRIKRVVANADVQATTFVLRGRGALRRFRVALPKAWFPVLVGLVLFLGVAWAGGAWLWGGRPQGGSQARAPVGDAPPASSAPAPAGSPAQTSVPSPAASARAPAGAAGQVGERTPTPEPPAQGATGARAPAIAATAQRAAPAREVRAPRRDDKGAVRDYGF